MHLHNINHTVLISPIKPEILNALNSLGVSTVTTKAVKELISYEQYHADMQLLIIGSKAFICGNSVYLTEHFKDNNINFVMCDKLNSKYPDNVRLNAALVGENLICKKSALDQNILMYCNINNINIIDVKQGYAKCSTLIVNNSIITADRGIYNKALDNGIEALLISVGNIELKGADYGFIGGCSGVIGDTVVFFGDINTHPDANVIINFIQNKGFNAVSLLNNKPLEDIGGIVQL